MARTRLKVSLDWRRNFEAPAALMRVARDSGDVLAVDEDARLYLLSNYNVIIASLQLPWMPAAAAVDGYAATLAVISPAGRLLVLDRGCQVLTDAQVAWRPTSLDISPAGSSIAFVDGAGKVGVIDLPGTQVDYLDSAGPYYHVRFAAGGADILAVGQFGKVLYVSGAASVEWHKDYRCHTSVPSLAHATDYILIPSPYYGIIALHADGREKGLFDVPEGPKVLAVNADAGRVFVMNEKNELMVFESEGRVLFRQPLGGGLLQMECDAAGETLTTLTTTGAVEKFIVGKGRAGDSAFIELELPEASVAPEGPRLLYQTKVFSALGGQRSGEIVLTPQARFAALLDVEGNLRMFDHAGKEVGQAERIIGRQPDLKASRAKDFIVAASSDLLMAIDLRGHRQRRMTLKNEWITHFDIAPAGLFYAVADFFRGISLFDDTLERAQYLETDGDVFGLAVDGNHHVMAALATGVLAFYTDEGGLSKKLSYPASGITALVSMKQGFAAAADGKVDAFDTNGTPAWSVEVPGTVDMLQPVRAGLIIGTVEGQCLVAGTGGAISQRMLKRGAVRFFDEGGRGKAIASVEYRGRLLSARSTAGGILWRRDMPDDIASVAVSPEGAFVAVLAGIYLYLFATSAGQAEPKKSIYLEI